MAALLCHCETDWTLVVRPAFRRETARQVPNGQHCARAWNKVEQRRAAFMLECIVAGSHLREAPMIAGTPRQPKARTTTGTSGHAAAPALIRPRSAHMSATATGTELRPAPEGGATGDRLRDLVRTVEPALRRGRSGPALDTTWTEAP